jgi:hypothetical protein
VPGRVFLLVAAKRLFTSTFAASTPGFRPQHYRRVGDFAALASGEDDDLSTASVPPAPTLATSEWNQRRLPVPAYLLRRAGEAEPSNP